MAQLLALHGGYILTDSQMDRQTDKQTDRQIDRQMDRQTNIQIYNACIVWLIQLLKIAYKF